LTGGTSSGGKSSGGTSTGGVTGGTSTGGKSTGGTWTGGAATGGTSTGGAPSNGCTSNPCLNGSSCTAGGGSSYTCSCTNRFVGTRCEIQKFLPLTIRPTALSADGTVVVGAACSGDRLNCPPVKIASTGGTTTTLAFPTTLPSGYDLSGGCEAHAVNGTGSWIGAQCYGAQGWSAIEWKASNTAVYAPGRTSTELIDDLNGASFDGSIIVGALYSSSPASGARWFRRIPTSGIVQMSQNPSDLDVETRARAASNDGLVVVGTSGVHAVRWDPTFATRPLAELSGQAGELGLYSYLAVDVSGDGSVMVGFQSSRGGPQALRWNDVSTVQSLGIGVANAVNLNGSVVVGHNNNVSTNYACLWNSAGTVTQIIDVIGTNADVTGWNLQDAVAVSDDGKVIVGTGTNGSGVSQGWVLHLP
jgi:hypothetical protein